ncbi:MAG: type IV secretion system protein VirB4, partial [Acetobacteraceae bacterium]
MFGDKGTTERSGEVYLPYVGHVSDHAVLLRDGSMMAMGHVSGTPFELEEPESRNARSRNLNTLFRNIADDNVTVCTHLIRHPDIAELPPATFRSEFAARLDRAYRDRVLDGKLFRNDYFFSLVVSPRNVLGKAGRKIARLGRKRAESNTEETLRALEDVWHVVTNGLEAYGVRRLGLREKNEVLFTEIGEALRLMITCRWMPVPMVNGSLGASIYTDRVICGKRGFEVRAPAESSVGTLFSFREYPAKTRPGMLDTLLNADFPLVLSQSYAFLTRAQAHGRLSMKSSQMVSAGDKALTQIAELAEAEDALASNEFVMGSHHLSLAVYADTLKQLADRSARARARLTDAGAVVVQEGIGMEAAFWSQLPGNIEWRTRPGAVSSRNFA